MPVPFETVGERLLREGIAPRHVRRYLRELRNHMDDYAEDCRAGGLRWDAALTRARDMMGDDDTLVTAMLSQKWHFQSFISRQPCLTFIALPIAVIAGFFLLSAIALALAGWIGIPGFYFDNSGRLFEAPLWYAHLADGIALFGNFALPLLTASVLAILALRQRTPLKWPLSGIALTALLGIALTSTISLPASPAGRDWTIALVIMLDMLETPLRLVLALAPMALLTFCKSEEATPLN